MRTRLALPILLASASVMACGLGIASAQDQEEGEDGETPAAPNLQAGRRLGEAIKNSPVKLRPGATPRVTPQIAQKQTGRVTPPGPPETQEAPNSQTPGQITEFQTGIDYEPVSPGTRVTFNLEDADLPDLVRLISSITGKRFILPSKARNIKATVYAPTKVTAREAYNAFLSILEINGMTVVPAGRYLKIVDTAGIQSEPTNFYNERATPSNDGFLTRMHRISNVSAEDVAQLLGQFKSSEGSVTAYAPTNTLIMTDMGSNIRRMLRVIEAIDVPRTGEQVWIERIHYANATELAARLQEIFPVGQPTGGAGQSGRAARPTPPRPGQAAARGGAQSAGGGSTTIGSRGEARITKILPDERTNSLIILATERAYLRILELIRELDVPLEGEGRIHVHYIQHGDAEEVAQTLSSLVGGSGGGAARARAGQPGQAGGGATAAGGGDIFEGEIRVTAHQPSNALVIVSSLHDYAALRRVIERLDARRRQVFIEAVIMELSVNRSRSLGLSFHGGAEGFPEDGSLFLAGSNAVGSLGFPDITNPDTLTGLALGIRGPEIEGSSDLIGISVPGFGVALTALATSGDANILSTPHIIAMDNEEAEISVGANVPLQTSGFGGGGGLGNLAALAGGNAAGGQNAAALGALAGLGGGFGSVPRQDVGTTIRITPHINESDEIRMEIEEEISEAQASTEGTLGVRSVNKRTAKTQMVVRDQQTVVIGGLMRDSVLIEETKIPILGDIPLLGVLFRQTRRTTEKVNLLLFLTPYIIRDSADLRAIFERKMRERQEFIDRYFVFGDHDYEPPVDYTRTRGLVAEIINELEVIETERQMMEALRARPPPEHIPRQPIGSADDLGVGSDSEGGTVIIGPDGAEAEVGSDIGIDVGEGSAEPEPQQEE